MTLLLDATPFKYAVKNAVWPAVKETEAGVNEIGVELVGGVVGLLAGIKVITAVPACTPFERLVAVTMTVCVVAIKGGAV